jgi:hypothetical protein
VEQHLDYEVRGIHEILKNCSELYVKMGGIYIDGKMEAFSIGTYNELEKMAIIHIEKANPDIQGLYQGTALLAHPILLGVVDIAAHGPVGNGGKAVLAQFWPGQIFADCPQVAKDHNIVKVILRQPRLAQIPIDNGVMFGSKF